MQRTHLFLLAALALGGCDNGRVTLAITDAPLDEARRIVIEFRGVELESVEQGLQAVEFSPPRRIDLLAVPAGQSELLLDAELLPAGDYSFIRLLVNAVQGEMDSVIELDDGGVHSLRLSEGDRLTLSRAFELTGGGEINFTIDFNLRQSIEPPPAGEVDFVLRPALRLVEDEQAGRIAGVVAAVRIEAGCSPAVYVFSGRSTTPDDVDAVGIEPLTSALVELDAFSGFFRYTTAPLPEGDYTLAFTCEAAADDPTTSDDIAFPVTVNAEVTAEETVTADIPG